MASVVNSVKRVIAIFAALVGVAVVTILLYDLFVSAPISGRMLINEVIGVSIIIVFWSTILLFIRHFKPAMARVIGVQAATVLQLVMAIVSILFMVFLILSTVGVSPESLLTGAGFASITIGLVISTFVGSLLAGALVFTTHRLREGDTVIVNGAPGVVVELTLLVTRVRTGAGQITIPNSAISSGAIVITKVQKFDGDALNRLPFNEGDRVVTTYMQGEGTVKQITALRTIIRLDDGREISFLNSAVFSGSVAIAKITGSATEKSSVASH